MLENLIKFRDVSKVFSILQEQGGESRFVGGCVRNILCNKEINDLDIATTLRPEQVELAFKSQGIKTINIGKDHGTIVVVLNSYSYEITTLRRDVSTDGRRAVVEYSDNWEEDALRRDFTINAMSYCPYNNQLYDYFNGVADLKKGIIRFVGDPEQRVQEDYLRILRFFRFYTYCGTDAIDKASLNACIKYSQKIHSLSAERKFYEFYKILEHKDYLRSIKIMLDNKILDHLFEHRINENTLDYLSKLKELSVLNNCSLDQPLLRLFILTDFNKITIESLVSIFNLPNKHISYLKSLKKNYALGIDKIKNDLYKFIYEDREGLIDSLLCIVLKEDLNKHNIISEVRKYINKSIEFPLGGNEIMKIFHITEGKEVGAFLGKGLDFWYKSKFTADKQEIIQYLKGLR